MSNPIAQAIMTGLVDQLNPQNAMVNEYMAKQIETADTTVIDTKIKLAEKIGKLKEATSDEDLKDFYASMFQRLKG